MTNLSDRIANLTFTPRPDSVDPAGLIKMYGGTTAPDGWLECDGSAVSRTTYAELFDAIGTKYGVGDGSTTFNLPNGPRRTQDVSLDLTFTTGTVSDAKLETGYCFQNTIGNWFFVFTIDVRLSSAVASPTADVAGVTFKDVTGTGNFNISATETSGGVVVSGRGIEPNTLQAVTLSGTADLFIVSGIIPLDAKPTDGFVGADGNYSTFDEALEALPIIKAYPDRSDISMGLKDATATATGAVRLSTDFEASSSAFGFVKKNKWQDFTVGSDQTSPGTVISIGNLVVGVQYRITATLTCQTDSTDSSVEAQITHDGVSVDAGRVQESSATSRNTMHLDALFTATTTTATLDTTSASANAFIEQDNGSTTRSFVRVEELRNYEAETSDFTP